MKFPARVVCLGEVLWDLLPSGPQLGGAPSNLACHVAALGGRASLVSRVGDDPLGRQALALLRGRGVDVDCVVVDPVAPTGTVGVELAADGQPRFTIHENVAWDRLTSEPPALEAVAQADAVCFGSLGQRNPAARETIRSLVKAARPDALIVFDINLRPPFYDLPTLETSLTLAGALKLNDTELEVLSRMFDLTGSQEERLEALARRFHLETVLLTLGAEGSRLWTGGQWTTAPGRRVVVRDTVGAGDSFTAAFILGRLLHWDPATILNAATEVAAFVCTQSGATPDLPESLSAPFRTSLAER